jgi:hypothetical protein
MGIAEMCRDFDPAELREGVASAIGSGPAYHALIWMGRMLAAMPDDDLMLVLDSLLLMEDQGSPTSDSEDDGVGARLALRIAVAEIAENRGGDSGDATLTDNESVRREINHLYWLLRPGFDEQQVRAWLTTSNFGLDGIVPAEWINARRSFQRVQRAAAIEVGMAIGRRED